VLDVGSNTVHLLVVDAHRGAHPTPMSSEKTTLRLTELVGGDGTLAPDATGRLVASVRDFRGLAAEFGCADVMAFATSAVREVANADEVLATVRAETGVELRVLSGEDEARLTFLAARRWYGWSAGQMLVADIGGGSLELAVGVDEYPDLALSVPLGAGRTARTRFTGDPPSKQEVRATSEWLDGQLAPVAKQVRKFGEADLAAATSKTFRTLARLTGAAPSSAGPRTERTLSEQGLTQLISFISRMPAADLAELDGVSARRAHQLVAGALVAQATMRTLGVAELHVCPWALREGVILRRLDHANGGDHGTVTMDAVDGSPGRPRPGTEHGESDEF
jgi:exopolyphosphatase/guanosine-5'-triphosphate,3'-diphosphate pyrophosphatase